jgi:hypothetical protein
MELIEQQSGVSRADAFRIDRVNLFDRLGGDGAPFVALVTAFYLQAVYRPVGTMSLLSRPRPQSGGWSTCTPPWRSSMPSMVSRARCSRRSSGTHHTSSPTA